jgi:hypothetical protein
VKSVSASFKEKMDRTLQSVKKLSETAEHEVELASRKGLYPSIGATRVGVQRSVTYPHIVEQHQQSKLNQNERESQSDFREGQLLQATISDDTRD